MNPVENLGMMFTFAAVALWIMILNDNRLARVQQSQGGWSR